MIEVAIQRAQCVSPANNGCVNDEVVAGIGGHKARGLTREYHLGNLLRAKEAEVLIYLSFGQSCNRSNTLVSKHPFQFLKQQGDRSRVCSGELTNNELEEFSGWSRGIGVRAHEYVCVEDDSHERLCRT